MIVTPFQKPGRFYRGNLHTHSNRSDGRLTPEQVCEFYRGHGYDFLAITDHFMERFNYPITDTTPYASPEFATILGAELHAGMTSVGELWHILAVGLPADFAPPTRDEDGEGITRRAVAAGAYVAVAHPWWYNLPEDDAIRLHQAGAAAIETINGISADHNDRIDSWYMLDALLGRGYRLDALATDDAHFNGKADTLRGWAWVKAESLSSEAILAALKAGDFYNSSGPMLHDVVVSDDTVTVRCSPVSAVFVTGRGAQASHRHGTDLTEVTLSIRSIKSPYIRITVRDAAGGRAWTNPIWLGA